MVAEPESRAFDLEAIDEPLDEFLDRVAGGQGRVVVRRGGVPLVVIEPAAVPWREDQVEFLREISNRFADVPLDEIDREVGAAIAEVRRQRRERQDG